MSESKHSVTKVGREEFLKALTKQPKYHNKLSDFAGKTYHSKREATHAQELQLELKAGKYKAISEQVRYDITVYDTFVCSYIADFVLIHLDDTTEIQDVKGVETKDFRLKWKLMKVCYPTFRYTIIH